MGVDAKKSAAVMRPLTDIVAHGALGVAHPATATARINSGRRRAYMLAN